MGTESETVRRGQGIVAILETAEHLFATNGFDGVSLSAIAEAAGTSKANILYHFRSKEVLYQAVLENACREGLEALRQELDSEGDAVEERLRRFARQHLKHLFEREDLSRLVLREIQDRDNPRGRELAENVLASHFRYVVSIIEDSQAGGVFRQDFDPGVLVSALVGADLFFFMNREVLEESTDGTVKGQPERYSDALVDILLQGILRHPA
ncbi:transcriptional regulator, TetR family [Thiohalospira halophila DSM 15071]|uniref:Transcriptional regulator, TetR family n=1 Tax=Thiohalospira halophila DSM 15071 TaxID=1123397 RepID=A0A1I1P3G2_9GAMM|nr:TetR/AcrR family transcriptional regulator [Thiohalospira halophila]SFD01513.1 transcriptional regulator, TetR family [Thiohalospira halophila DSM 15071]